MGSDAMTASGGAVSSGAVKDVRPCTADALDRMEKSVEELSDEYHRLERLVDAFVGMEPKACSDEPEAGKPNGMNDRAYGIASKLERRLGDIRGAIVRLEQAVHG